MFAPLVTAGAAATGLALHGGGGLGFGLGFLFILVPLFWIGVAALLIGLSRRRFRRNGWAAGGVGDWGHGHGYGAFAAARGAESTLAQRFAHGDIDEQEYRARLEVIRANSGPTPQV